MKENRLRAEVVKRRKQLKRSEDGKVPEQTWSFLKEMGWVQEATEMFDDEAVNYLAGWLDTLDAVAPSRRPRYRVGEQLSEQSLIEDDKEFNGIEEGQEYFEVELGEYEKERQRAFAEVIAREANTNKDVMNFRRDYLGGSVLTSEQAYSFLESPAARYLVTDLFLGLQIPAAKHRAEIVGRYEQVSDVPNDVEHRVTINVDPPGTTLSVRYARPKSPVTDEDQTDARRRCVPEDSQGARTKPPNEVLLRYRDRDGVREVAHIWPGSVLDELRHRGSMLAKMYGWTEEDMVWFLLTGEAPRLSLLTLHVRLTAGHLTTITMTAAPWVSAETIKKNHQKVQSQMLPKGKRAPNPRSIAVLRFVERNIRVRGKRPPWSELLEYWNREHPEWKYQSYGGLRQTYHRTLDAVVYAPVRLPEPKPSAAVKKRAREALARAREMVELDRKRGSDKQPRVS